MRPFTEPDVAVWLDRAESDRQAADTLAATRNPVLAGIIGFHCQQEAEKLIKGTMVRLGIPPPRMHDLVQLVESLSAALPGSEKLREAARLLTPMAVLPRYPGPDIMTLDDADEAMRCALEIRTFLLEQD